MIFLRRLLPVAALASFSILSLGGCKSGNPSAPASNPQTAQNPQQVNGAPVGTPAPASPPAPNSTPTPAQRPAGGSSASSAPAPAPASAPAPQTPPPPAVVVLPPGTHITVRLDEDLGSRISQPGDSFAASVADDVVVDGQTVIAKGSRADGTVIEAKPLGKIKGGALLSVRLDRVHTRWGSYAVSTSSIERAEKGKGKRTAVFGGAGGAFGALVGGLAGGGKGALIGLIAGGGAGTAGSAFTGNKDIVLPAETELTFRLESPVHITEQR